MAQYVLGINLSHDRSACLLENGQLVVAIEEERLDRIKHSIGRLTYDNGVKLGPKLLPWRSITYCLDAMGIGLEEVDLIMIDQAGPAIMLSEMAKEIPIKNKSRIRAIPHPSHHLAHAYSAYFCSPFEESAILVTDNIGSYFDISEANEGETGYYAKGLEVKEQFKTISRARDVENASLCLGRLYRMGSLLLGFYHEKVGAGYLGYLIQYLDEGGKTMGLAPYGKPRKEWPEFVTIKGDELDYANFIQWIKEQKLFSKTKIKDITQDFEYLVGQFTFRQPGEKITKFHEDLAYAIQSQVEKGLIHFANRLYKQAPSENLCIAGGVGLNSVANEKVLDASPFKNIFIQPAATDDGNAVGAAYYGWYHYLAGKTRHEMTHAFLGRSYSDEQIESSLIQSGFMDYEKLDQEGMLDFVSGALAQSKIIGWFQEGAEFGPRALGHRSILADPRHPEMKDILNTRVKFRESFRPYAPSILAEQAQDYFDITYPSPFMLLVAAVQKDKRDVIPAVTHVDGTARLQTVDPDSNNLFYQLIQKFYEKTDVPVVLNTSFNIKGEPIVETPFDAINCFLKTDMDYLVMGNYVVKKEIVSEDLLGEIIPMSLIKVIEDEHKIPRFFHVDIARQEIHNITTAQADFLKQCDGEKTVANILAASKEKVDLVRDLFRRRWITFKVPFANYSPQGESTQDF
jgi:carbamoyltransferase